MNPVGALSTCIRNYHRLPSWPRLLVLSGLLCLGGFGGIGGCDGGNSSETVGSISVTQRADALEGKTAARAMVGIYAAEYLPLEDSGFADTLWADSLGRFTIEGLAAGSYNLVAWNPADGKSAFVGGFKIPAPVPAPEVRRILGEPGTLQGRIADSLILAPAAFLPGTPFSAKGDTLGRYSLTGLPPGTYLAVKSWKRLRNSCPGAVCGGLEERRDSTQVEIKAGITTGW